MPWASTSPACFRRRCSISRPARASRSRSRWRRPTIAGFAKTSSARSPHQVDALSAVQRSRGLLQDRAGIRRPQGRHRVHGDGDALSRRLRQRLHEDLRGAAGAQPAARVPRRVQLGGFRPVADQPLHRRACARLRLAQHAAPHQLAGERHAGALPASSRRSGSRAGSPGSRS